MPPSLRPVPEERVTAVNDDNVRPEGDYVLYWMIGQRRTRFHFGLEHAVLRARELGRPLLVLEPLRVGYRWASDRLHRFVLDGMRDNREAFARAGVAYHAYVEPEEGHGRGLLTAVAKRACLVVTDEVPGFFLPRMVAAAGRRLDVRLEQVDANGVLPLRAATQGYPTAYAFRRHLQKVLPEHLARFPVAEPLALLGDTVAKRAFPMEVLLRWQAASAALLDGDAAALSALPVDHGVPPVPYEGGERAAGVVVRELLERRLDRYLERSHPDVDAASGLSPWLHFGHVSVHEVVQRLFESEGWEPSRAAPKGRGQKEGYWGMSAPAEAFLDELVTWRELGYGFAFHRPRDFDDYASLPDWAKATLAEHANDPREELYTYEQLERAETSDEVWNAAQRQLLVEGRIHNYLRMLWGKRVLTWTRTPQEAARVLVELNNRWAVDGRDPNSYSGIFWVLGRHDRPWPERAVFGKVRAMTSAQAKKKLRLGRYLARWSTTGGALDDDGRPQMELYRPSSGG